MTRHAAILISVLFGLALVPTAEPTGPSGSAARTWSFDSDGAEGPPGGFTFGRTGGGREGRWIVRSEKDAPSGANVLAQVDTDETDYRFPVAAVQESSFRDLSLSVRCKPVSGKVDQACGLVFRYADPNNYYITRANALENNVRIYYVKDGKRKQFAGWNGKVTSGAWHELRVDAKGEHFEVSWDGKKVIDATDKTLYNFCRKHRGLKGETPRCDKGSLTTSRRWPRCRSQAAQLIQHMRKGWMHARANWCRRRVAWARASRYENCFSARRRAASS